MRPLRIAALAALVAVAVALAGVGLPERARGQEADPQTRSISATGNGTVTAVPDRAQFSFGVQAQRAPRAPPSRQPMHSSLGSSPRFARPASRSADIQTDQLSLSPRTNDEGAEILGYTAVSSVSVRLRDLDRAGAVVDAAVGAGANQVYGPSLVRSNQDALYRNALRAAYADAREAQALAERPRDSLGAMTSTSRRSAIPFAGRLEDAKAATARSSPARRRSRRRSR